jgi:hypothetical protein
MPATAKQVGVFRGRSIENIQRGILLQQPLEVVARHGSAKM